MPKEKDDLKGKMVDIRPFKRDFVAPDWAPIAAIREGFRFNAWHKDKIPESVFQDLDAAYPRPVILPRLRARTPNILMLLALKEYEKAITFCDVAIKKDPKDPMLYYCKGDALFGLDRYEEAAACYGTAIEIDPNDSATFYSKCNLLSALDRDEEALKCLERAIRIDPSDPLGYYHKGVILSKIGRYEDAIKCYDDAIRISPKNPLLYYHKGIALSKQEMFKDALKCFDQSLNAGSNDPAVLKEKATTLKNLGRHEEATEYYENILDIKYGSQSTTISVFKDLQSVSLADFKIRPPRSYKLFESLIATMIEQYSNIVCPTNVSWKEWHAEKLEIAPTIKT